MENSRIVCYANDGKAKTVQLGTAAQRAPSEGLGSHSRCLLVPAAVFLSWGPAASSSLSFSSSPGHLRRWSVLWPNNNNNNQRACERTHRRKPINPGPKPSDSYRLMESRAEERVVFPHLLQDCFLLPAASPDWWLYVLEQPVAWNLWGLVVSSLGYPSPFSPWYVCWQEHKINTPASLDYGILRRDTIEQERHR